MQKPTLNLKYFTRMIGANLEFLLKGVFAKNERGYWLNAIKKRF